MLHEITAKTSYKFDEPWGIRFGANCQIESVEGNGWAEKSLQLSQYTNYHIIKINSTVVNTKDEILKAKAAAAGLANVVFTLQKPNVP